MVPALDLLAAGIFSSRTGPWRKESSVRPYPLGAAASRLFGRHDQRETGHYNRLPLLLALGKHEFIAKCRGCLRWTPTGPYGTMDWKNSSESCPSKEADGAAPILVQITAHQPAFARHPLLFHSVPPVHLTGPVANPHSMLVAPF